MKNSKKNQEGDRLYWENFRENVEMIIAFEDDCDYCSSFIYKYGMCDITLVDIESNTFTMQHLLTTIIQQYIKVEEYEKCVKLAEIKPHLNKPTEAEIKLFSEKAKGILSYDVNCEVSWEVLSIFDIITFWSIEVYNPNDLLDYMDFMTKLVNYYFEKKDFIKCILLNELREEVIIEIKDSVIYDVPIFRGK